MSGTNTRSGDLTTRATGKTASIQHFGGHRAAQTDRSHRATGLLTENLKKMRIGRNTEVRPLGGGVGCLAMILFSVVASVFLTVVINALARL